MRFSGANDDYRNLSSFARSGDTETRYTAVRLANLNFVLEGVGPFTMFAPTNVAFQLLGPGITASLTLASVLQYHVCYGNTQSPNLLPGQESRGAPQSPALLESILSPLQELSTFEGALLTVDAVTPFTVNGVPISRQDLVASNGLVHTMNRVFLPPNFVLPPPTLDLVQLVASEDYLSILHQAIQLAELESALKASGPLTESSPKEHLLQSPFDLPVLLHHVVTGSQSTTVLPAGVNLQALGGGTLLVTQSLKVEEELCACPYLTLADRLTFCRHKSKRTGDEWLAARHGYGHHPNWICVPRQDVTAAGTSLSGELKVV
eukprot:s228_g12.t1